MVSSMKTSLLLFSMLTIAISQEQCISEHFLAKENSVFSCDFQSIKKNVDKVGNEYKCVHFIALPNIKVCGEVGLRFKLFANKFVNASISIRYFSDTNGEPKYEFIEMDGKYGWNHWSAMICADFMNGMNLYLKPSMNVELDRFLLFINPQGMGNELIRTMDQPSTQIRHNTCNDTNEGIRHHSVICDPAVQYFGWKITAIILMIVTVGSLILVISLSLTMPYNVWDKPKIQMLPVRLTDGAVIAN